MKLTHSLVAMATLTTLSFAGGDINPVTVFEQEPVMVPVEAPAPVVEAPVYQAPIDETPVYVAPVETTPVVTTPVVTTPVVTTPVVTTPVVTTPVVTTPVVTPKTVTPTVPVVAKALGLYLGLGLTDAVVRKDGRAKPFKDKPNDNCQNAFTGRLGYNFMNYLGAELRGTQGYNVDRGDKFQQFGAYLKPNYDLPFLNGLNVYGLLGASKTNFAGEVDDETGFSYGAGLDYKIPGFENFSIFTDMVNYMKKSDTASVWGTTLGAAYNF